MGAGSVNKDEAAWAADSKLDSGAAGAPARQALRRRLGDLASVGVFSGALNLLTLTSTRS